MKLYSRTLITSLPGFAQSLAATLKQLPDEDEVAVLATSVSAQSLAAMFAPGPGGYGYGWYVGRHLGRRLVSHGGWINGFAAAFARLPDEGVAAIVLSNLDSAPVNTMARDLAAIALGESPAPARAHRPAAADPAAYDDFAGRYELPSGHLLDITRGAKG